MKIKNVEHTDIKIGIKVGDLVYTPICGGDAVGVVQEFNRFTFETKYVIYWFDTRTNSVFSSLAQLNDDDELVKFSGSITLEQ